MSIYRKKPRRKSKCPCPSCRVQLKPKERALEEQALKEMNAPIAETMDEIRDEIEGDASERGI